ncbi:glutathione S-transferase family protein [Parasphingorhabdus sp. DH2-15]|uniref:glutathione S-transferase family protein n=1 Tax=Parasphingorhabdus sp. DH2-15 TaxID=3444112 RepID=UPI003F688639
MTQITLHHLEYSRSTRIIWLLEEMGIAYDMVRHSRDAVTFRSPEALAQVHPLAKAPTVIVDGETMVESGAIIEYLIERFGSGGKFAPAPGDADRARYLEWLHFAEGTMSMSVILSALAPRFGGLGDVLTPFIHGEVVKLLSYANDAVSGRDFLVGDGLTGADINLCYLLEVATAAQLIGDYPELGRYLAKMQERPAYKKSLELGGPIVFAPAA